MHPDTFIIGLIFAEHKLTLQLLFFFLSLSDCVFSEVGWPALGHMFPHFLRIYRVVFKKELQVMIILYTKRGQNLPLLTCLNYEYCIQMEFGSTGLRKF